MKIEEKLLNTKKSKLSEFEIQDILDIYNYEKLYEAINNLVDLGLLKPVKKSGLNGRKQPLYKRYWVKQINYDDIKHEIKLLSYHFNHEGYLKNPKKYIQDKDIVSALDNYFKYNINDLKTPSSINERSFKIFGYEKILSSTHCKNILKFNNIDYKTIKES